MVKSLSCWKRERGGLGRDRLRPPGDLDPNPLLPHERGHQPRLFPLLPQTPAASRPVAEPATASLHPQRVAPAPTSRQGCSSPGLRRGLTAAREGAYGRSTLQSEEGFLSRGGDSCCVEEGVPRSSPGEGGSRAQWLAQALVSNTRGQERDSALAQRSVTAAVEQPSREELAREAAQKSAIAESIIAREEGGSGRAFDSIFRPQVSQGLAALPLTLLEAKTRRDGLGRYNLGDPQADLVYTPVTPRRIIDTCLSGGPMDRERRGISWSPPPTTAGREEAPPPAEFPMVPARRP